MPKALPVPADQVDYRAKEGVSESKKARPPGGLKASTSNFWPFLSNLKIFASLSSYFVYFVDPNPLAWSGPPDLHQVSSCKVQAFRLPKQSVGITSVTVGPLSAPLTFCFLVSMKLLSMFSRRSFPNSF